MSEFDLEGKVAVVTGALGLLGREHCTALANAGARVVVTDVSQPACEQFAESLVRSSRQAALGIAADITDADAVDALAEKVLATFGQVDILVNNAAIDDKFTNETSEESRFEQYSVARFRKVLGRQTV